ncbi:MAG: hypothetical protein JSW39_12335 [Desulfobacterales bacterium]|nr:MAG: hypothetical protein JSW39_12335 [Desulfobacterales bacterium]
MLLHSQYGSWNPDKFWHQARRWRDLVTCVIVLSVVFTTTARAETVTDSNVAEKIADAQMAADHQGLAAYFSKKAGEEAQKVQLHEEMAKKYTRRGKAPGPTLWMRSHCQNLIRLSRQAKEEYESLAELHNWMAEGVSNP